MAGVILTRQYGDEQVGPAIIGKNSEQFTKGDPVTVATDGFLRIAAAGEPIFGYYDGPGVTMAATNQTVAKVKPRWIRAQGVEIEIAVVNGTTPAQTDIGEFADLSAAGTGAQTLASPSSNATAQFIVTAIIDADGDGTDESYRCEAHEYLPGGSNVTLGA